MHVICILHDSGKIYVRAERSLPSILALLFLPSNRNLRCERTVDEDIKAWWKKLNPLGVRHLRTDVNSFLVDDCVREKYQ